MVGYGVPRRDRVGIRLLPIIQGICLLSKLTSACDNWSWDEKYDRGCSTPTGSAGLWTCKKGNVGCYDCDVGERWDPVQDACQKCGGSLTSCRRNISPSACYESECEIEGATVAPKILKPTPTPTEGGTTTAPDSIILATLFTLRTSGASTKVVQIAETTHYDYDDDDDDNDNGGGGDGDDGGGGDGDDGADDDDEGKSTTNEHNSSTAAQSGDRPVIIGLSVALGVALCAIGVIVLYNRRYRSHPSFSPIPVNEDRSRPRRNRRFDNETQNVV